MIQVNRAAVIGLGSISGRHRSNIKKLFPEAAVYVLPSSDRFLSKLPPDADFIVNSIDELLKVDLDLVVIASPASHHLQHAAPFIEKGIHTFIEKPVVDSLSRENDLNIIDKINTKRVCVGYCLRFMPATNLVKKIIEDNTLGNVYNIMSQVGQYLPDWRKGVDYKSSVSASKALGGGALLELSHELDYAQWLFGDLTLEYANIRSSRELELDVEDLADIVLRTSAGAICNIHLDFVQKRPARSCSIIFERGRLDWDLLQNNILIGDSDGQKQFYSDPNWDRNSMYLDMLRDFMCGNSTKFASVASSLKTIRLIDEIKNLKLRG